MERNQLIHLVTKSQSGDQYAMEKLLEYAHTSVSYQCRKMLKNKQDAEDLTQEVLVTIYTKLDTLQEPAAFNKWANRITATRCMNALSRVHVEYQFAEDEDGHSVLDNLEDLDEQVIPDKVIDNAETARMIEEIVDALPTAQRAATLLFYYDELSVRDIAKLMKVSENTVKSRLNYARKAIKEKVIDYEKQGIKLYSLSPLPVLVYFLRMSATLQKDKQAAGIMVARIMAAKGTSAVVAGVSSAAAATGSAATGLFAGLATKVAVTVTAAALIVGGIVTVSIATEHGIFSKPAKVASVSVTETQEASVPDDTTGDTGIGTEETEPLPEQEPAEPEMTEPEVTEPPKKDTSSDYSFGDCGTCGIGQIYAVTLYDSSCEARGLVSLECNHCGEVVGTSRLPENGHSMKNGRCTVCGATQDTCHHLYERGAEQWPSGTQTYDPYVMYTCFLCGHSYKEILATAETEQEEADPILIAMQNGDFSYFAGTYIATPEDNDAFGGGEPLKPLILKKNGSLSGGGDTYLADYYPKTVPISVEKRKDGTYLCRLNASTYYIIYPVGVIEDREYVLKNQAYLKDIVYIRCVYTGGGVSDITYYAK